MKCHKVPQGQSRNPKLHILGCSFTSSFAPQRKKSLKDAEGRELRSVSVCKKCLAPKEFVAALASCGFRNVGIGTHHLKNRLKQSG